MDTATPIGGVALLRGDRPVGSLRLTAQRGHASDLPVGVQTLLEETGWTLKELDLIAVTTGPGSFTGLRVALGLAKGIVQAAGTPLVGVGTLEVLAAGAGVGKVAAVMDARRKEVYAGLYHVGDGFPRAVRSPAVMAPQELADLLATAEEGPLLLTGRGLEPYGAIFRAALGERALFAPESTWDADPVLLGRLAALKAADAGEVEPLYLRKSEAEIKKEQGLLGVRQGGG